MEYRELQPATLSEVFDFAAKNNVSIDFRHGEIGMDDDNWDKFDCVEEADDDEDDDLDEVVVEEDLTELEQLRNDFNKFKAATGTFFSETSELLGDLRDKFQHLTEIFDAASGECD